MQYMHSDDYDERTDKHFTVDVVCGAIVVEEKSKYKIEHSDAAYYFCSANCQNRFEDYPDTYDESEQ